VFTGSASRPEGLVVETAHSSVLVRQPSNDRGSAETALAKELASYGITNAGIGVIGQGIAGAAAGLSQAERALALSRRDGAPVVFRDEWLLCVVLDHLNDAEVTLGPAIELLRRDDSMRQTLAAYLGANAHLASAAAELFVHPNTVAYRLGRFAERSGIDARVSTSAPLAWLALRLSALPAS